jgi:asparagine synthase (glutamine-hydrolysing)
LESAAARQAFYDLKYYLPDDLLVKVDRASMAVGLESRVPLLDHNIVELALNIDDSLKSRQGVSKYLLKEILYDYVPKSMFDRPKWGFSIPLGKWLAGELNFMLTTYLSKQAIEEIGLFNANYVAILLKRWKNGEHYLYNRIWQLCLVQQWMFNFKKAPYG